MTTKMMKRTKKMNVKKGAGGIEDNGVLTTTSVLNL